MNFLINQDICTRTHCDIKGDETDGAIVEEIQLTVTCLCNCGVMSAMLGWTHVIDERYKLVGNAGSPRRLVKKKAIQVQVTTELDVFGHFSAHESKTLQLDA